MKYIKTLYDGSENRLVRRFALMSWGLPPRTTPFAYCRGLLCPFFYLCP